MGSVTPKSRPACGAVFEAALDDQPRFFGGARFDQRHGAGFLDAIDIGLRQDLAHFLVEIAEHRDHARSTVGSRLAIWMRSRTAFWKRSWKSSKKRRSST